MIRSTVIVEGNRLDLLEDVATDFTYSISDIREPESRRTDFSKTIELPGTARNNTLFAQLFDINIENDWTPNAPNIGYNFNPNKVAKALILLDGIEVFRGVIRVLKVNKDNGKVTYETNVLGRLADILFAFGDKKLSDINFSDLDHMLSFGNIQHVWNNPGSYRYAYPLIDYGLSTDGVNYPIFGFAPALYVKEYIDRMFSQAGFTYNCPFFSQPYFQSLIIPSTEKKEFTGTPEEVKYLALGGVRFGWENNRLTQWREMTVPWTKPAPPTGIDKYNWFNPSQPDRIVINREMETSFQINLRYLFSHRRGRAGYINVRLNGQTIRPGIATANRTLTTETIEIPRRKWNVGDTLTVSIDAPPNSNINYFPESTWLAPSPTDSSSYPIDDETEIQIKDFVSKSITQRDFFKSIILMHNLYIFTDESNDKNLFIVPQAWFYDTFAGNAVDWTYKMDYSRKMEITPMGELAAREYLYTYKKDTDYYNDDRYFKVYEEVFGQAKTVVDNDFEKDTKKVELIFSPTISVTGTMAGGSDLRTIPHIYKVDKDLVKQRDAFNIRILQYGGLKPSMASDGVRFAPWQVVDSFGNDISGPLISYPYAGMLDDPVAPTRDLCFGPPRELWVSLTTYPNVGLYKYWWEGFINEITNKDSKLLRAYFNLTPADINQLDFKRLVKVDNTYYKLNKIDQYNPLAKAMTRVELFKTDIKVEIERPGFLKWSDEGYLLHSDETPARIPTA